MTNKDYIAAVFGAIMGITAIVVTFPWMTSVGERLAKDAAAYVSDKIQKNKKSTIVVDNGCKIWHYPTGTFEHEVKRTE